MYIIRSGYILSYIITVIHAQTPPLEESGSCINVLDCMDTPEPGINYGDCCGDPARVSFAQESPLACFNCPSGMPNFCIVSVSLASY